ncbi:hypothetical protein HDE_04103 [Halotydeus destructor]|nr:hypothetical protein HDE_04103 [Halotydeus destructor]
MDDIYQDEAVVSALQEAVTELNTSSKNDALAQSRDLALSARGEMHKQNYSQAIHLLSQAIQLDGKTMSYHIDICLCYRRLKQHREALKVINNALKLAEENHALHGEKGHILMLMGRFKDAESSLRTACRLKECDLYVKKQFKVRELALLDLGFNGATSRKFAGKCQCIDDAIAGATEQEVIHSNRPIIPKVKHNPEPDGREFSALSRIKDVNRTSSIELAESCSDFRESKSASYLAPVACHSRPVNIFGCKGLFIYNLNRSVTVELAKQYFSEFGTITDLTMSQYGPHSALITYTSPSAPVEAIYKYNGRLVDHLSPKGERLKMRFKSGTNQKYPKNHNREWLSTECKYWRTTGCDERIRKCTRDHLPMCRGIDYQPWMVTDIFY